MSLEYLLSLQEQKQRGYSEFEALLALRSQLSARYTLTSHAATTIQRHWRGYNDRQYIASLHRHATTIQRVYRGYIARKRVKLLVASQETRTSECYYSLMATKIQRVWRGHYSRIHFANYYRRRLYLATVTSKGHEVSQSMADYYEREWQQSQQRTEQRQTAEFELLTENFHHLLSTKAIPGILKSKLGADYDVTVNDVPVEQHIKVAFAKRQKKLKAARAKIRREKRQTSQYSVVNQFLVGQDGDSEDYYYANNDINATNHDDIERFLLDEYSQSQQASQRSSVRAGEEEKEPISSRSSSQSQSRFPPINGARLPSPPVDEDGFTIPAQPSGRSIILSRDGRPVTVERPKLRMK